MMTGAAIETHCDDGRAVPLRLKPDFSSAMKWPLPSLSAWNRYGNYLRDEVDGRPDEAHAWSGFHR